jgi:hypothetical protein
MWGSFRYGMLHLEVGQIGENIFAVPCILGELQ